jgi:hypothetical protein
MSPDIQNKLRHDFPEKEFYVAIEMLSEWDAERKGLLDDRLFRCAIFLAKGDIDRLKIQVELGKHDYRDLIVAAEYEGDLRVRDFTKVFSKTK